MSGKGKGALLTNSGVAGLSTLTQMRGTPQGDAAVAQIKTVIDGLHGQLTFSNRGTGTVDVKGEALFNGFMARALPVIEKAYKAGTLPQVLDPKSRDYIGNEAASFSRSPTEMMDDRFKYSVSQQAPKFGDVKTLQTTLSSLDNDAQREETVREGLKTGRIPLPVYTAWYKSTHAGPNQVQLPPLVAH